MRLEQQDQYYWVTSTNHKTAVIQRSILHPSYGCTVHPQHYSGCSRNTITWVQSAKNRVKSREKTTIYSRFRHLGWPEDYFNGRPERFQGGTWAKSPPISMFLSHSSTWEQHSAGYDRRKDIGDVLIKVRWIWHCLCMRCLPLHGAILRSDDLICGPMSDPLSWAEDRGFRYRVLYLSHFCKNHIFMWVDPVNGIIW